MSILWHNQDKGSLLARYIQCARLSAATIHSGIGSRHLDGREQGGRDLQGATGGIRRLEEHADTGVGGARLLDRARQNALVVVCGISETTLPGALQIFSVLDDRHGERATAGQAILHRPAKVAVQ